MIALLLDIVTTASLLFLVAGGLLVIYGVLGIINFAHAALVTAGAYAGLVVTQLGLSPWLALPLAFLAGAVIGMAMEAIVLRRLYARPLDAILATWGIGIVIGQAITLAFGREVQFVAAPVTGTVSVLGESYSAYRLLLVLAALVFGIGFAALLGRTRLGLTARAVIMNETLARALGIDTALVRFITFALGSGLAALAGALLTPLAAVEPALGVPWLVNAFMLVMLAGASFGALAVASLALGAAQVLVSVFVSPILGGLTIVLLAALVLRIRPGGFARG